MSELCSITVQDLSNNNIQSLHDKRRTTPVHVFSWEELSKEVDMLKINGGRHMRHNNLFGLMQPTIVAIPSVFFHY